jgi:uncharacterized protein
MVVRPDAELVDARGNIFNCTETSYVPAYGEPNLYQIGTSRRGEEAGARDKLQSFNERLLEGRYDCHACRVLPVCGGSCPKDWREGRARCPPARSNIEQRLLFEYARAREPAASAGAGAPGPR